MLPVKRSDYYNSLENIYSRIESEKNWCVGCMAKDRENFAVTEDHPEAYKYCLLGSIARECFGNEFLYNYLVVNLSNFIINKRPEYIPFDNYKPEEWGEIIISNLNDRVSHKEVLATFRSFIREWKTKNNFKKE